MSETTPSTGTRDQPWTPTTAEDWQLARKRARNWHMEPGYPWWLDPRVSLTPADYAAWQATQPADPGSDPAADPARVRWE
ncbi:MAG: hypothetical protein HC828_04930 [Blastochloris sp.]|nr:hypothetical protein [Blastochloris sp.]